jgi:hypothetical protein
MKVLVLLSGGVDSSCCIAFYRGMGYDVRGVFVDYGQPVNQKEEQSMPVPLTKIVDGRVVEIDTLPNQRTVKCPKCARQYRLGYPDNEWHKLSAWLGKAQTAMRASHKKRHAATLELRW